tara:strand:+ start:3759 stop:5162 length:1404 start_codon:yes stop_codon:yes gene_type:complete
MITIIKNLDSTFYSVYRPIIVKCHDASSDTAFLRGELLVESPLFSGTYVASGIIINGYESSNSTTTYEFNLMEHCRPYVGKGISPLISYGIFFAPGDFDIRKFKLNIWAVKYSSGLHGQLYDDTDNIRTTKDFTGLPTVTTDEYSMNHNDDWDVVDRLVLGYNNPSFNPNSHQPLTNAPNRDYGFNIDNFGAHQTINSNDFPFDSIYQPVNFTPTHTNLMIAYLVKNKANQTWHSVFIPITNIVGTGGQLLRIPLHPTTIEMMYLLVHGVALNKFLDASGNLIADAFFVMPFISSANGTNALHWTKSDGTTYRYRSYALTDKEHNGKCQRKKFVFENMKGGFDWFNCYGTNTKSVSNTGETYENHQHQLLRGFHTKQKLWTKRTDTYKVITQPLSTEKSKWLQELITSPKVWVQEAVIDGESSSVGDYYLRPIVINDGDVQIHNTEDNVHYVEFSYTLSTPISTQRG